MERKSLIKDDLELTPEIKEDPALGLGLNTLLPLLAPNAQDPDKVLGWIDEHVVGNPYFDEKRAAALKASVERYYQANAEPPEGTSPGATMTLAESATHPGIAAKREKLSEIFEEIGPVVRATRDAILNVQSDTPPEEQGREVIYLGGCPTRRCPATGRSYFDRKVITEPLIFIYPPEGQK